MRILDIFNRPWAIMPEKFETIREVYDRHAAGEKFDVEGLRAAMAITKPPADAPSYTVENGVAVIPIDGILSKKMNIFSAFSGGTSTQILTDAINKAAADDTAHSIILSIDSPGGEVDGVQIAAQAVAAVQKPVIAWLDGMCCSGAYWIASQANALYIADATTIVGSIGVVMTHTDRSKANEQAGKKVTEVTAGKYKRIASSHAPLSTEGQATLQDQVDQVYSVFVDDVANGLGASTDTVLSDMADGRVFIGQQAIDAGLAAGVASLESLIQKLAISYQQGIDNPGAQASATSFEKAGHMFKTFATEADYTAAIAAEFERGKTAATVTTAQIEATRTEAATAERERIQGVEDVALAGHEDIVQAAKYDGKSTGADVALKIITAEKKLRGSKAADLASDAPAAAAASVVDTAKEAAEATEQVKVVEIDPMAQAARIRSRLHTAHAEGRKISTAQASMELEAEDKAKK